MFRAKDIAFYGSAASFNQHFISEAAQQVLCSLDVAVRGSEVGHKQPSFWPLFMWQDYKRTGKPLPLAFFTSDNRASKIALDLFLEAAH